MKRVVSFAVKSFCIFAVMFSLSTAQSFAGNNGGNGSSNGGNNGSGNGGGSSETKGDNDNTIPPIILRPR